MSIHKNNLVQFKEDTFYEFLDLFPGMPMIVIKGPYEGVHRFGEKNTSLSIVVDLMCGTKIIQGVRTTDLKRCKS